MKLLKNGLAGTAIVVASIIATAPVQASTMTYTVSGTITDTGGPAAGSLTSIGVGNAWSLTLSIDSGEAELAGCSPGSGPCDYGNASGQLTIGSTVLNIGPSPTALVEVWNDLATIDGVTDGISFPIVGDGSIVPTQVDGLYVAGIGLALSLNSSALADASLAGTGGKTSADFIGPQQGLLIYFTTQPDGAGDYALVGAAAESLSVVPVPAAGMLFSSALLGLLGLRRRRA